MKEAREVLRVDALSEEDRKIYQRYLRNVSLALSLDDSSRYEGYVDGMIAGAEKGRAEGIAEGAKQQAFATARKMKAKGLDLDTIADFTGLTPDEIAKI